MATIAKLPNQKGHSLVSQNRRFGAFWLGQEDEYSANNAAVVTSAYNAIHP